MKHSTLILVCFVYSIASNAYAQDSSVAKHKKDSLEISLEKKFWESGKEKTNSMFLSFAAGYSSMVPDDKINDFLVYEASIGIVFERHWIFSLTGEFWYTTFNYYPPGWTDFQVIKYRGFGTILSARYRFNTLTDKLSFNCGIGFGQYVRSEGIDRYTTDNKYPTFNILAAVSYHPVKYLSIDCRGTSHFLLSSQLTGNMKKIFNIKIGVSYYLFY